MSVVFCNMTYLYISLGAIAGAISRYQIDAWLRPQISSSFPWPTLLINVSGSLLIGMLASLLPDRNDLRLLLMVGFCGSYTTFSTYSLELVKLMQTGKASIGISYLVLSALLAPIACYLGFVLTSR
jgi:fluoride exporter